jgi:hypothetical protein
MNAYERVELLNPIALVRKRPVPTEQPPFVGEISGYLYG